MGTLNEIAKNRNWIHETDEYENKDDEENEEENKEEKKDFEKLYNDMLLKHQELQEAFDKLQIDYNESITQKIGETKKKVLDNFDEDVARNLKIKKEQSTVRLDVFRDYFWKLTHIELLDKAVFDKEDSYSFILENSPSVYIKK